MTLEESQGHQTNNENLDPEEGYNHAKFERPRFGSVREKGNVEMFFKGGNMSLKHVRKS